MPRNKRRAGQRPITHGPQQYAARASHRALAGAETGRDFAGAHALEADGLVFDHQVHQQVVLGAKVAHRPRPPSGQAVGIQGDAQAFRQALFVQRRHQGLQIPLKQTHLLHMVEQPPTDVRRRRRRNPHQHRLADPRLQQLDALGDRRLRQPQHLGRPFETGLLDHRGQGRKQFIVEHQFS